ncbi:helix-turn-helix domain-containing protein [Streptomyces sp. NPDC092952]|uniref:helix-turn-helix domain-containing protein n=1 Tax=Streptomyces sp. NPDC092952 TaxID=3366018 RepID=UPI0038053C07
MGRPENDVDQTVPARAALAEYLRWCRREAGLTYSQMSEASRLSKATFERAASGSTVPAWDTVELFITVTCTNDVFGLEAYLTRGHELWVRARRATRAPYYVHKAPDPTLLSDTAGFLRALRHQHVWAGYPTPGEMESMAGTGMLPKSTVRRIIAGDALPVDPPQTLAFLQACYVRGETELERWLSAAVRALRDDPTRSKDISKWVKAHQEMVRRAKKKEFDSVTLPRNQERQRAA